MPSHRAIADDLHVSFATLAAGRCVAMADVPVIERRSPACLRGFVRHKARKGQAMLREVLRMLPAAPRMRPPLRGLFLERAATVLVAPAIILLLVGVACWSAPAVTAMFLVLVLGTVNGFLMLDLIYVLTMGGPGQDTTTISWLGFQTAFSFFKFGPGTAILYTLTALCLLLTFVYHWVVLRRFEAEA